MKVFSKTLSNSKMKKIENMNLKTIISYKLVERLNFSGQSFKSYKIKVHIARLLVISNTNIFHICSTCKRMYIKSDVKNYCTES